MFLVLEKFSEIGSIYGDIARARGKNQHVPNVNLLGNIYDLWGANFVSAAIFFERSLSDKAL